MVVEENRELFFFPPVSHMKRLPSLERSAAPIIKSLLASQGKRLRGENVTTPIVGARYRGADLTSVQL